MIPNMHVFEMWKEAAVPREKLQALGHHANVTQWGLSRNSSPEPLHSGFPHDFFSFSLKNMYW